MPKPTAGDVQEGLLTKNIDSTVTEPPLVPTEAQIHHLVDLYSMGDDSEHITRLFIHEVGLKGREKFIKIKGLFDDGAMVNSICSRVFRSLQNALGKLALSSKTLRMADGTRVPSQGCWRGDVSLGGHTVKGSFKVFPSGGGWSLLVGKPLLKQFKAVNNYDNDTLMIPQNGVWNTLVSEIGGIPEFSKDDAQSLKGDVESSSRQVSAIITQVTNLINKQKLFKSHPMVHSVFSVRTQHRKGRRARNKLKQEPIQRLSRIWEWWNSVWVVQDDTVHEEPGELQPEVELGANHSLFTRATDPCNPLCVAKILKHISISNDLTPEEKHKVRTLITEFADCFALSVWEVLPIPGAEHHIHIPPDVVFPKKIPHQRQLMTAQQKYLSDAIDELLAADIIEPI